MSILNVEHLTHGFGDRAIFSDVSFRLLKGEHIGLVGANGEGKSTFMSIVTGKLMPESMDFNGGNSTGFQQCCISALDYPRLHASGSSRQNICGAIFTKTFRIKQQLVWQRNFPVPQPDDTSVSLPACF